MQTKTNKQTNKQRNKQDKCKHMRNKYATKPENWISNRNRFLGTRQHTQGPLRALPVINSQLRREKHPKGRFTRYDFDACDKLTTGPRHDLGPFTRVRHFHFQI